MAKSDDDKLPSRKELVKSLAYIAFVGLTGYFTVSMQAVQDDISNLRVDYEETLVILIGADRALAADLKTEIDKLLESGRNWAAEIADLSARVAALEEAVATLKQEVDRVHP